MKVFTYEVDGKRAFSFEKIPGLLEVRDNYFFNKNDIVFFLGKLPLKESRGSFCLSDPSLLFLKEEGISLLKTPEKVINTENQSMLTSLPTALIKKINNKQIKYINTAYPNWEKLLVKKPSLKWRINLLALGDVGSTLLIGLKLLGGHLIESIGIFDTRTDVLKRWEMELNQISLPFNNNLPEIKIISKEDLFDCNMFVFCASKAVPPIDSSLKDVRMVQFEENSKIIKEYARLAREASYEGIFSVVSDPVDQLCYSAFKESNTDREGIWDYKGLMPEQIRGYGLGVMNARAIYHSKKKESLYHYEREGRAFGPHGKGLIIADSIYNYDNEKSLYLTEKTIESNLEMRALGYKPYIAPALSSGAVSIIKTISGEWHYSSSFLGGAYFGCKNRYISSGIELERISLQEKLEEKITNTYKELRDFNEKQSVSNMP
jgi:hypothetical protein